MRKPRSGSCKRQISTEFVAGPKSAEVRTSTNFQPKKATCPKYCNHDDGVVIASTHIKYNYHIFCTCIKIYLFLLIVSSRPSI
jgi:hypothetical protein